MGIGLRQQACRTDPDAARLHREALALRQRIGDHRGVAESLIGAAAVVTSVDRATAAALISAAERLRTELAAVTTPRQADDVAAIRAMVGEHKRPRHTWRLMTKQRQWPVQCGPSKRSNSRETGRLTRRMTDGVAERVTWRSSRVPVRAWAGRWSTASWLKEREWSRSTGARSGRPPWRAPTTGRLRALWATSRLPATTSGPWREPCRPSDGLSIRWQCRPVRLRSAPGGHAHGGP